MVVAHGVTHKSLLSHPSLRVRRTYAPPSERTLYSITELSGTLPLCVNNADITTLECALLERMYYCKVAGVFVEPPPVTTGIYTERLADFSKSLLAYLPCMSPISLDSVVEMYTGYKRIRYGQALDKFLRRGLTRKDGYLKCFVKNGKDKRSSTPRHIQPRDPVYNLQLAAYIKPAEHRVYRAIDRVYGDGPTVMKGYNVDQVGGIIRGKWRSFARPVAIGLDAVKFDVHVSVEALEWEHSIYNRIYHCKTLQELLKWQVDNIGFGWCKDGSLKYKKRGGRASGDMNTASGNCLIMCGLVHAYAKSKNIPIKLVNNGDDCVVFMEDKHRSTFMKGLDAWFLTMGFRMTAETPVYNLCEIEFCQMHPIELSDGKCRMVRNIPVALRKDSLCTVNLPNVKALQGWMTAVGTGGLALTGGIPVMQNLYRKFIQLGKGRHTKVGDQINKHSGLHLMSYGMKERFTTPSSEVRLQVFIAWGITPDEQLALEKYIDSYELVGFSGVPEIVDSHINNHHLLNALSR